MRSELKIGIVVGVVLVVGIIIFVVKSSGNGNDADNSSNSKPDQTTLQVDNNLVTNPPTPTDPTPTDPAPVEPVEVVLEKDDETGTPTDPDTEVRNAGLLDLLRIPALFGEEQPELAAAALYASMRTLAASDDVKGSISIRRELLDRYGQTWHAEQLRNDDKKTQGKP